ncbi:MAG TPA: TlpA disulfide reductase family protein [Steroidobacteraceae bacterium]|nr:TlpA disulfide reductase family protein [Steroidobacteraceae bacterium]
MKSAARMVMLPVVLLAALVTPVFAADAPLTEDVFRQRLGFGATVHMAYRDLACNAVKFDGFTAGMKEPGAHADVDRSPDGKQITMTVRKRGMPACPSPYPPITELPPFDLRDLGGKRVTSAALRGKPTLINFFFSTCVPCILEVKPLNQFAAQRPQVNFLAVTFDEADVARAFVDRFGFRWRIVPDARDFIDRVRVKNYPMMALFDAQGRLLGTRQGGARDELEAANVGPQLALWMDGLLRQNKAAGAK